MLISTIAIWYICTTWYTLSLPSFFPLLKRIPLFCTLWGIYTTPFCKFQRLSLEFFHNFFCPFLNCLQERESGDILSFLLNHCAPFIPSKCVSYRLGHFSFFRWQDGLYNSLLEISFYIMYTINMCLTCFRKSQFPVYMCVKICVVNKVF